MVSIGRFFITESAQWLVARGRIEDAERETERLLRRAPPYPGEVRLCAPRDGWRGSGARRASFRALFDRENRRATILAWIPWFLQDLGTYGIGIFTPTILAATFGHTSPNERNLAEVIYNTTLAAEGTAFLDVLLLVGMLGAIVLDDRLGRIRLQIVGFIGCALGLAVVALSAQATGSAQVVLVFAGFMLFNLMTNLGPNAMTYLIAGEIFPTHVRGIGAGFAASCAKLGAVLTAFLFPIVLNDIGTSTLLYALVGAMLLGALVTRLFAIETCGVNLEALDSVPDASPERFARGPGPEPVMGSARS